MRPELRPSELEELAGCLGQAGGRLRAEFAAGVGREDLRLTLEAENIEARPVWKPMHLQPVFQECEITGGAVSEELFERGLCLPSGSAMTENDLQRVVDAVRAVTQRR